MAEEYIKHGRTALGLGEQMLDVFQRPATGADAEHIQVLTQQRGTAIEALSALGAPTCDEEAELLRALAEQQALLETRLEHAIADLKKAYVGAQATRSNLESFRRIMSDGTRSRMLNKRT